jgi:hypothetical protein
MGKERKVGIDQPPLYKPKIVPLTKDESEFTKERKLRIDGSVANMVPVTQDEIVQAIADVQVSEFPKKCSSGSCTDKLYSVEARYNYTHPIKFFDMILDKQWRKVNFTEIPQIPAYPGVQSRKPAAMYQSGLVHYAAAQALRWGLHAESELNHLFCLETRLVEHVVKTTWDEQAVAAHEAIDERGKPIGALVERKPQ